jgi:hypothetical protein
MQKLALSALIGILLTAVMPIAASAQSEPMPEDEYWAQVEATRDLAASLDPADPATRAALAVEAQKYSAFTSIRLADGTVTPIDNSFLVALLHRDPPDLDQIQNHLNVLLTLRGSTAPTSTRSTNRPTLAEVLARPEFQWQEARSNPIMDWINDLINRIVNWLRQFIPGFSTPGGTSPLMLAIGGVILALLLGFALRGLFADLVGSAELHDNDDETGLPLTAASALQKAQDTAQSGDYRTAVRFLYLSTLLQLEEHHLLRYDRARTNREYLRSVAHLPELATLLRDVVDVFDRVWYGYQSIDEEAFQTFVARVTELRHYR